MPASALTVAVPKVPGASDTTGTLGGKSPLGDGLGALWNPYSIL